MTFPPIPSASSANAQAELNTIATQNGIRVAGLDPISQLQLVTANLMTQAPSVSGNGVYNVLDPAYTRGRSVGDGTTDATDAIVRTIDAAPAGSTVLFPPGFSFRCSDELAVSKALTFVMWGATITQATASKSLFTGSASDCNWFGGTLVGPQYAAQTTSENAIKVIGASAANPAERITVFGVRARNWGGHGVYVQWAQDVFVNQNRFRDINYAGIGFSSVIGFEILANRIRNIVGSPNAYGIYMSKVSSSDLVTYPRTADGVCSHNVVRDVTNWEGIDTHAGQGISIVGNRVKGCFTGILVGSQTNGLGADFVAPLDVTVTANTIDSGKTDGSAAYGIAFTGAAGGLGTSVERATGAIVGNVVRGHGTQSGSNSGAIYVHDTTGLVCTGNTIIEPSPTGIRFTNDNDGFVIADNTIIDQWSTSIAFPSAIEIASDYQKGTVANNRDVRASKSATYVCVFGIRIGAGLSNSAVVLGGNEMSVATTPYSIGTGAAIASDSHGSPLVLGTSTNAAGVKGWLTASVTWDPPSLATGTQTTQNIAVSGAALGDIVTASFSLDLQGMQLTGAVRAANSVQVVLRNGTAGTIDLASGTLKVLVSQL